MISYPSIALFFVAALSMSSINVIENQTEFQFSEAYEIIVSGQSNEEEANVVPELNERVVAFCEYKIGRKVGSGQCSDLVYYALKNAGAKTWNSNDNGYGKLLNPLKDVIMKGDVLQFNNAVFHTAYKKRKVKNHKAIIVEVLPDNHYKIAHQNVNNVLKVRVDTYDLSRVDKGVYFYRPISID